MPTKAGEWKTVKVIEVTEEGLQFHLNQLRDNPVQARLVRVHKSGKVAAPTQIMSEELTFLMKEIPEVQKFLAEDEKRVADEKAKAAKAAKGNGGATKSPKADDPPKSGTKKASGKKASTKKASGKKASGKKATGKKVEAKKEVSIDDIL
jgi:hypothetical protein